MMRDAKKPAATMLALVAAAALAACGSNDETTAGTSGEDSTAVTGKLTPVEHAPDGYAKVKGEAELERADGTTTVSLNVSGLEPKTAYLAHLHVGGCDQEDPGGPHFQFKPGGSEEPPNEIHLELTTDAAGKGEAEATSKREVPVGKAGSIVIHQDDAGDGQPHHEMTAYTPGEAEAQALLVHEGVDHSKLACAELEGAPAAGGSPTASADDVPTIVVREGEPVGGVQRLEFDAGEEVRFRVSSDAAEEVHVHGYDLAKDVPAGGTVEFAFPAELEGIYEAELEQLGVQIAELQINP
jgi:hypothetical protein